MLNFFFSPVKSLLEKKIENVQIEIISHIYINEKNCGGLIRSVLYCWCSKSDSMYIRVQSSGTKILAETFDALGEEELSKDFRLKWLRRWPPGINIVQQHVVPQDSKREPSHSKSAPPPVDH